MYCGDAAVPRASRGARGPPELGANGLRQGLRRPKACGLAVLEDDAGDEAYAVCELIGRAGTGILKTPCVVHRIDQPSPNFGRTAKRSSLRGVIILRQPDR
jgi:hypothetical protein